MTREEAKVGFALSKRHETLLWIDKIYDEFESMTCENCKHGGDNYMYGDCPIDDAIWASGDLGDSFGCNKWEDKNDN